MQIPPASPSSGTRASELDERGRSPPRSLLLVTSLLLMASPGQAQLTTGTVEGFLLAPDGRPLGRAALVITGEAGFRITVRTGPDGAFTVTLPYGSYRFSGLPVFVAPLQTTDVDVEQGVRAAAQIRTAPDLWSDSTRARVYPEALSLPGVLLSREPATVTEPLDYTGLSDNRLWLASQRAISWTSTQYKLQGIDATDSYQPGRPLILPNVEALDDVVVRSGFGQTTSTSCGPEIGLFLTEPSRTWHGALASAGTGSFLSSSNLPPPADRGLVQQADAFRWLTRDGLEAGGPVTRWADLFASAAGQWASQRVPLAAPGNNQRSRLLFGTARGRIRASARDQFEGLYVGSRIDLSDWGVPAGIETLAANRVGPPFVLPGGFLGESEVDHLDFAQAGWTHVSPEDSGLGTLQVRYGYSTAHLDGQQTGQGAGPSQSRIELLNGILTGAPPLQNFAVRTRHSIQAAWQPETLRTASIRHEIVAGGGWSTSSPRNRLSAPSNMNLITADGAPAFVARFTTPLDSRQTVRSFSMYAADHVMLPANWSLDAGILADFSRGSVRGQPGSLIAWNSFSPRVGFAWQVPHAHGVVLRGAYFRLYAPLAGRYLDFGDPNSLSGDEYAWIDRNGDGWFEPGEQGPLLMRFGGLYSSIARSLKRPYSDEFDLGADFELSRRTFASVHLFRRDDKDRLAGVNTGVTAQDYTPVAILDPGPDGIAGTYDDQQITVYQQSPASFGQDRYLLTNPPGLRELYEGLVAGIRTDWHGVTAGASFVAEKSWGPANPGDGVLYNDPGVLGALFLDPNTAINATGHGFFDRAYVGKVDASYRLPWGGIEVATVADYLDGLVFARQFLVTGLAQGPLLVATTVRGSPEGGNRAEHVTNWNLRIGREFLLSCVRITATADFFNLANAGHAIQENELTGPSFYQRLPVALQAPRSLRLGIRIEL
jgi:hypothetical protein